MRGICSFCVLLAHCGCCPQFLNAVYTPFFLAAFFFLSGYCHKQRPFVESIGRWGGRLLFPYFALASIIIALSVENFTLAIHGDFSGYAHDITRLLCGKPLWFVACLAVTQLYFTFLSVVVKKEKYWVAIMVLCFTLMFVLKSEQNIPFTIKDYSFWYCDTSILGLAYFIMGHLCKFYMIAEKGIAGKRYLWIIPIYIVLALVVPEYFDVEFHLITNYYSCYGYFMAISVIGIYAIYLASNYFNNKYINLLGYNSLLLFASSGKIHTIMDALHIEMINTYIPTWCYCLLFCFIQGCVIILLGKVVNRYCPVIVGK